MSEKGDDPAVARRAAEADATAHELRTVLGVVAAVVGLVGYVVVTGLVVTWVRLAAARLPADVATGTIARSQLLGDGARTTVLMAGMFGVFCVLAYISSARRWDAHEQDWHDLVRMRSVGRAREHRKARAGQRTELEEAPLGRWAVRLLAGFNVLTLASLAGLALARALAALFPMAWYVSVGFGLLGFVLAREVLTRHGPLHWKQRTHVLVWGAVAFIVLFTAAPIAVLLLTSVGISTFGRALGRIPQPHTTAQFLHTPLPWVFLTVCGLLGVAYHAMPPVAFPRVVVTTPTQDRIGGFLAQTDAGVYLVTCTGLADATSSGERIILVAAKDVVKVTLGGPDASVDSGYRPSLAALGLHALGFSGRPPTWLHVDLRPRRATCAGVGPSQLAPGNARSPLGPTVIVGPAPPGGRARDGEHPIQQTAPGKLAQLARRYQPTLEVTVADRNWPVALGAVLAERGPGNAPVCLVQKRTPKPVCPATPRSLTGTGATPADYLQLPAALGDNRSPDAQLDAFARGQDLSLGSLHQWLANPGSLDPWSTAQIYFYDAGPIQTAQWPARARDPRVPSGLIGFEYWFYYPYNYYPLVVDAGLMGDAPIAGDHQNVDLHQGDWEHVVVLLDQHTLVPKWLYTARHADEGQFFRWSSPPLRFDGGHPVVQAAFGGHPSYLAACGARPRARALNATSDWLVCGSDLFGFRASSTPLVDLARQPWACWPGYFGEAVPGREVSKSGGPLAQARQFVFAPGPRSPLQQAENEGVCNGGGNPLAGELATIAAGH